MRFARILMNAADASTGSGGAPQPAVPPEAPAQPAPVTVDDATRKAIVADAANSFFAEARRLGLLNEKKSNTPAPKSTTTGDPPAQQTSVNLRSLDRAIARAGRTLSESAYARVESAFASETPSNVEDWLKDYFEGLGITAPNTGAPSGAPPGTNPTNAIPASNGSPPPPPKSPVEERKLIGMPQADVEHLVRTKGVKWFRDRLTAEMRNVRVRTTR